MNNQNPLLRGAAFIAFFLFILFAFYFKSQSVLNNPISFDEADYINASKKGIVHNALGKETLSLIEFITLGNLKLKHKNVGPEIESYVKTIPVAKEDVFMLRHYHPPIPIYYWNIFMNLFDDFLDNIIILRISNYLLFSIYLLLFILGAWMILGYKSFNWALTFPISVIALSPLTFYVYDALNFHVFFSCALILFLLSVYRLLEKCDNKNIFIVGLSAAILTTILETAIFVFGAAILGFIILGLYKKVSIRSALKLIAIWLSISIVLWPSFLINGEIIKSWGMYAYRIFGKENLEYSSVSYLQAWKSLIGYAPVLFLWLFTSSLFALVKFRSDKKLMLCLFVSVFYAVVMTPFILNKTYVYPAYSGLILVSILVSERISFPYKNLFFALGSLLFLLFICINKNFHSRNVSSQMAFEKDLKIVDQITKDGSKTFIQNGHIFDVYFPNRNMTYLDIPAKNGFKFTERFDYLHKDMINEIEEQKFSFIVLMKNKEIENLLKNLANNGYTQTNESNDYFYYSIE